MVYFSNLEISGDEMYLLEKTVPKTVLTSLHSFWKYRNIANNAKVKLVKTGVLKFPIRF